MSPLQPRKCGGWASQVADAGYTPWELWSKGAGTDNHGWNGGPLYVLSAYALGVRPTAPGYATYEVTPQPGGFTSLHAAVPTAKGTIRVQVDRPVKNVVRLRVISPRGTSARIGVPTLGMTGVNIKANGTTVYSRGAPRGRVSGLVFAGRDTKYVYFTATPGLWTFEETGVGGHGSREPHRARLEQPSSKSHIEQ